MAVKHSLKDRPNMGWLSDVTPLRKEDVRQRENTTDHPGPVSKKKTNVRTVAKISDQLWGLLNSPAALAT